MNPGSRASIHREPSRCRQIAGRVPCHRSRGRRGAVRAREWQVGSGGDHPGSALAFMDGSVVNVALPALQAAFHATGGGIQWVVQGYALFSAALLLLGGAIGDHYGRRRTFVWGVALFALASAGCAASFSLGELVAARAVQGVGAALLIPQGLSILSASFSGEERGRAIGTWSAWTSVFGAVGPVAGGWLLQVWSWRLIFVLNLPLALWCCCWRRASRRAVAAAGRSRWTGWARCWRRPALRRSSLRWPLRRRLGWHSLRVMAPLACGGLLLAAFLWSQAGRANAMMPLSLFRIPRFLAPNLLTFLLYGALGGGLYVIPFYVIQVRHYAPAEAGAVFLPLVAMMFFFSARVGARAARVGERRLLAGGAMLAVWGSLLFACFRVHGSLLAQPAAGGAAAGYRDDAGGGAADDGGDVLRAAGEDGNCVRGKQRASRLAGLVAVSVLVFVLAHGFGSRLGRELGRSNLPAAAQQQMTAEQARLHDTPIPCGLSRGSIQRRRRCWTGRSSRVIGQ